MAATKGVVWMTMAAAAGTLVVAIGVIAGPSIYGCATSPEGLLSCLRQDVVEAGLLPPAATPVTEKAPAVAAPTPVAAPEPAPEPPSDEPDLNLIRAEPDGHVLIAGSAEPGIEVEVFANGDLVGKVIAEASGDWVLVPDHPLATGSAEISVGIAGTNERSPHTFTVTIPEDRTSQPVITASEPIPAVEPSSPQTAVAEPEPETPPPVEQQTAEIAPEPQPPAPEPTPAPEPDIEVAVVEEPEVLPEPSVQPDVLPEPEVAEALPEPPVEEAAVPPPQPEAADAEPSPQPPVETAIAPEPAPVAPPHVEQPTEVAETEPPAVMPADEPTPVPPAAMPLPEPPTQVADAEPATKPTVPPVIPVPPQPPTIDAIEIDGAANYFAGAGPEGATVQLFVQDRFIASAKVEGGRWLVEAQGVLTLPVQRVRVDILEPQGDLAARAEVNFVIDVPPPAPEIEAAAIATGEVNPAAAASGELAVAPQVESELEVDPAIPTLRALPSVAPGMLRFASGKAIIRRGETLWGIAERVYGEGERYPLIVDANRALIPRPGKIYPGQVFELPKVED